MACDRVRRGRRHGRELAVLCRAALALILSGVIAAAQSGEPSWRARVEEASSDALALEQLVAHMRARAHEQENVDADLASAYVEGTARLAQVEDGRVPVLPPFVDRMSEAHEAALRFGDVEARARVAMIEAHVRIARGELAEAEAVLVRALTEFSASRIFRPTLAWMAADLCLERDALVETLDYATVAIDALLDREQMEEAHAWLRPRLLGLRGRAYLACGMPDMAARDFAAERDAAFDEETRFAAILDRIALLLVTREYAAARNELSVRLASHDLAELQTARLLVYRGIAECKSAGDESAARATLTSALALTSIAEGDAFEAELQLVDLAARADHWSEASAWLEQAGARASRGHRGFAPTLEQAARVEAHRSRLARGQSAPAEELARRRDALARAFTRVLDSWKRGRVRAGGLGLFYFGDQRFVLSELVALELTLDTSERGRERALDAWMRAQSVGSLSRALELAEVSLDEVRGALVAPGTGLLVYLPAPQSSYVFAVDGSGIVSVPLAADSELDARRRAVSDWLSVSPAALTRDHEREERARTLAASIDALSRALLPEAIDTRVSGWTSVIVVGADVLGSAPFECLTTADGRVLGLDFALSHLPSLQVGVHLARSRDLRRRERDVCVYAASQTDPNVRAQFGIASDFAFGDAERARVASAFASARVSFVSASDATVDRLLAEPFERTAVLAVFAHGVYAAERERPAGLLLAAGASRSSVLWSDDVERGRWPPLVVLLACGAARGPTRPGDDVGGHLGHAFFTGGASAVALNSFDMPYGGALTLASVLHRELAQGHGAAEALRRARRALASESATNDPHFYGSLRLLGLGATRVGAAPAVPETSASNTWRIRWLVVGVVSFACVVWLRRSRSPRSGGR